MTDAREQERKLMRLTPEEVSLVREHRGRGGRHYRERVASLREMAEALGLNVWRMSDETFVKRLCQGDRVTRLLEYAAAADEREGA